MGLHDALITIDDPEAGNNTQTVAVTLEVTGRAAVCRDTQMILAACDHGGSAPDEYFEVWNCGLPGTTLQYTITDDADWISCDPTQGSSTGESDVITVQLDCAALPAGLQFGTITVTDPAAAYSPETVTVALDVTCPASGWLPWDMNYDGYVTLIGDVPPFVDCVYFSDCNCRGRAVSAPATATAAAS